MRNAGLAPRRVSVSLRRGVIRTQWVDETQAKAGARFLLAEMPDDPALGTVFALLREHGFREEARVPDFYREGVALTFLRLEL